MGIAAVPAHGRSGWRWAETGKTDGCFLAGWPCTMTRRLPGYVPHHRSKRDSPRKRREFQWARLPLARPLLAWRRCLADGQRWAPLVDRGPTAGNSDSSQHRPRRRSRGNGFVFRELFNDGRSNGRNLARGRARSYRRQMERYGPDQGRWGWGSVGGRGSTGSPRPLVIARTKVREAIGISGVGAQPHRC